MKKNPQILVLVGAPGSGKSTFAKYFLRTEENWMRLCRDDFRTMHFTWANMSEREEKMITDMIDVSIESLLNRRFNVIVDATHCKIEYLNHYIDKFNHLADISFKIFETDPNVLQKRCEQRNRETGKYIPARVIKRYAKDLEEIKKNFDFSVRKKTDKRVNTITQDENLPKAIICDLDGTLALMDERNPFDASNSDNDRLNKPVAEILKTFAEKGYHILLVSGREDCYREPTVVFLEKHGIKYNHLWMRKSKDYRKDYTIKKEIYEKEIENKYYIEFVLDDRDQVVELWRNEIKLPCLQVNYGHF